MKPVVICRFAPHEGPGYFATYLETHRIAWRVLELDEGEPLPRIEAIGGLAMMGGPMSANDDLPWIEPTLALVRDAVEANVPVIGHCLGGQLMSRALGGRVTRNAVKEIGWGRVDVEPTPAAAAWGTAEPFVSFHWHGETFTVPEGATRIWSSAHCANQAFVLGPHIAMQCHVEMTAEMIDRWCETGVDEIEESRSSPGVQTPGAMRTSAQEKLEALNRVADRVYSSWVRGLRT
jgi:GMP synthase-like glutamine amidotransferase